MSNNIIDSIQLSGTVYTIQGTGGGGTVDTALDSGSTNPVENRVIYNKIDEVEQVTARALNELNEEVSEKQDTLVSGTNIKTINNTSILGSGNIDIQGGGKAIEAGRGISVTTGETADTVSFNLPISAGTGAYSIAEGYDTKANGLYSHAEGYSTIANNYSHAEGSSTQAIANYSHAEGSWTKANGLYSHAEGDSTKANGYASHAEGKNTIANNYAEHASGQFNASSNASNTFGDSGNTLFSVGNGTANNARHNAFEIRQNGDIYLSSGGTDIKLQDYLGGGGTTYTAGRGINITNDTISVSLPISAGTGVDSVLIGFSNSDKYWMPKATANGAIAAGAGVSAMSECSFAFGYKTKTTGNNLRKNSFAHGYNSIANGSNSHAEGNDAIANGSNSHAEGKGVLTNNEAEHSQGQYNNSVSASTTFGDSGNTLFSVGNGTSSSARHNAFEIRQNGDIYLTKDGQDVKLQDQLGGSSITVDTALDSGSTNPVENRVIYNKIDEVEQVTAAGLNAVNSALGGLKLQQITQSAYDVLTTKDASTLYIITE